MPSIYIISVFCFVFHNFQLFRLSFFTFVGVIWIFIENYLAFLRCDLMFLIFLFTFLGANEISTGNNLNFYHPQFIFQNTSFHIIHTCFPN